MTEREKFEADIADNKHSITSQNVMIEQETGRVVAVFYNDYDLESCIEQMQARAEQDEWISVDDGLPDVGVDVMTEFSNGERKIQPRYREKRNKYGNHAIFYCETLHSKQGLVVRWKPLPKEQP